MGQRLCLEIKHKGKPLANSYYHWSAYTCSTCELVNVAYNFIEDNKDTIKDKKLLAILSLASTGAGFPVYEKEAGDLDKLRSSVKYFNANFPICNNRNEGLIACYASSMHDTHSWMEGYASIDIDTMTIDCDVFNYYDSIDDYLFCFGEEKFDEDKLVDMDINTTAMSISEYNNLCDTLYKDSIVRLSDGLLLSELG